jgi:rhomboid protease GluP
LIKNLQEKFSGLTSEQADLIILILTSQGIKTTVETSNATAKNKPTHEEEMPGKVNVVKTNVAKVNTTRSFTIVMDDADLENANASVEAYFKENTFLRFKHQIQQIPISSFKSIPAFCIMGILLFVHIFCLKKNIQDEMILEYGASALFILQGETYRAVTALFLHADARHLLGNMAGMLIFAAPAISLSGYGTGPLMLLFAGTSGNLINAYLYRTAHLSIGASTAVMAAAGMLAAYQVTRRRNPFQLNNFMPIFAGALLMGMFSQGENTDIWAHVLGFICGLFSGIIFFPLNRTLIFAQKEKYALFITIFIVASAWASGFEF